MNRMIYKVLALCAVAVVVLMTGGVQAQDPPIKAHLGEGPRNRRMECTVTVSKVENKVIAEIYAGAKFRNGTRFHRFLFVIQDAQGNPLWDNFSNPGTITIGAPRDGSFRSEREHRSWDIPAAVRERAAKVEFIFQFKDNGGFPNLPPNLAEDVLKKAVEMLVQG